MHTTNEKIDFSRRLKTALKATAPKADTVTAIAIQFNLRYEGEPISAQAVHKWLTGQAMPSMDKLVTLAKWLGVTTDWLRYGSISNTDNNLSETAHLMLIRFNCLSTRQQELILALLSNLMPDD
jgi:hypothetical protein